MVTRNGIWESRSQPAAVSNTQSKGERLWVAQRKPKEYKREVLGGSSHESQVAQKSGDILILGYPRIQVIQVG